MSSEWKSRYTEKQLEKKRRADRLNQQRLRRESKNAVGQLEERLQLSLRGDHAELIRRLLDENAKLRSTVEHYRSCLREVMVLSRDCLEYDDVKDPEVSTSCNLPARNHQIEQRISVSIEKADLPIPSHMSVYFQVGSILNIPSPTEATSISMEKILEAVTAWKLSSNHGLGSQFLVDLFALNNYSDSYCTPDELEWRVSSDMFYKYLFDALTAEKPFPAKEADEPYQILQEQMSRMERQKRMTAFCTYEMLRKWRSIFASPHDFSAIFWSLFKYFQFLTFPSLEALKETPCCLWPTPMQFSRDHPGIIDYLIWPRLREAIASKSDQYKLDSLLLDIVQNFELRKTPQACREPIFVLVDTTDIRLNAAMNEVVYNLENFRMGKGFERKYPDLARYVPMDTSVASTDAPSYYVPELGGNPSTDVAVQRSFIDSSNYRRLQNACQLNSHTFESTMFGFDVTHADIWIPAAAPLEPTETHEYCDFDQMSYDISQDSSSAMPDLFQ